MTISPRTHRVLHETLDIPGGRDHTSSSSRAVPPPPAARVRAARRRRRDFGPQETTKPLRLPRVSARTVNDDDLVPLPDRHWPRCLQVRPDGHLQVGAVTLTRLAELVGTPFVLGDPQPAVAARGGADVLGSHDPLRAVLVLTEPPLDNVPVPRDALHDDGLLLVPLPALARARRELLTAPDNREVRPCGCGRRTSAP